MKQSNLWSLRLGFSNAQAQSIETLGIEKFVQQSLNYTNFQQPQKFLDTTIQTQKLYREALQQAKALSGNGKVRDFRKEYREEFNQFLEWWLQQMYQSPFPLREKLVCFWHNHFVSTTQKVNFYRWIYVQNNLLREHALGNFKELTKKILHTNAMIRYLDNNDNIVNNYNENLSRELLELFTLGIGNYTEQDIKQGAKGLAGLGYGADSAEYKPKLSDNDEITYLGKKGRLKMEAMVDQIFAQKNSPYLITRKILQWFIYDNPPQDLIVYYGDFLRKNNFEIAPFLQKICTEEYAKNTAGSKIKNPLEYIFELNDTLQVNPLNFPLVNKFLKQQSMDLYNQPNVKGWVGGSSWITSQTLLQRNNVAKLLINGNGFTQRNLKKTIISTTDNTMQSENNPSTMDTENVENPKYKIKIDWDLNGTNKTIIKDFCNRLVFIVDDDMQKDMELILKYDFNPQEPFAKQAILRLLSYITQRPEFQII